MTQTRSPLAGLRVLDLSRVLAGPYAGRMLADLGADVVKVEPPEGDVTRKWGRVTAGLSGYYTQQNAGKRNVCVDLRSARGPELLSALASVSDVLIENFRPGVMAQFGLDYATLAARNSKLVMLSLSGFGQHGPEVGRPAYAAVIHAESGLVHRQAALSGSRPVDLRVSLADTNAALHGLVGLLSALWMRERTGVGQHVDVSMLETMLSTDDYVHLSLDGLRERGGVIVNDVWEVVGGPILIAGDFRWVWRKLHETFEIPDPAPGEVPVAEKARARRAAVESFFASFNDRSQLIAALERADLPFGEVKDTPGALQSATLTARGAIAKLPDRAGGQRSVMRAPYHFSAAYSGPTAPAPYRGEHNRVVLSEWLGMAASEIVALESNGVLLSEPIAATEA